MKLNKSQRFTAYCIMLEEAENTGENFCFCPTIERLFYLDFCRLEHINERLPELYNKRPRGVTDTSIWFGNQHKGWQMRMELLKQCIIETHPR